MIAKNGKPLEQARYWPTRAKRACKRTYLGEGWHWITPIYYEAELKDDTVVEPGKVGVVTQLGGDKPAKRRSAG